ncbi:MAG: hypothetical protein QOF58_1552 [Pseudonocardiales bacterium]|jgi:transposase|nr:hypothetical protein [Pseudonocardiales bacterium]
MKHDLRAMVDAIGYLTRYGIEWRALPVDFPPWEAVYAFFERWSERGLPQRLVDRLRGRIRIACGRAELPTAAVIDAQTVRGADTVAADGAGYDAGKKTKGRKRNIATDCPPRHVGQSRAVPDTHRCQTHRRHQGLRGTAP